MTPPTPLCRQQTRQIVISEDTDTPKGRGSFRRPIDYGQQSAQDLVTNKLFLAVEIWKTT